MNLHMSLWVSHQWVLFQVLNRVGEKSSKENENHSIREELESLRSQSGIVVVSITLRFSFFSFRVLFFNCKKYMYNLIYICTSYAGHPWVKRVNPRLIIY